MAVMVSVGIHTPHNLFHLNRLTTICQMYMHSNAKHWNEKKWGLNFLAPMLCIKFMYKHPLLARRGLGWGCF